jgi:type IV secretory pathway protease TraF
VVVRNNGNEKMSKLIPALSGTLKGRLIAAVLLLAGATGGGAISSAITAATAANEMKRLALEDSKARLIGSYAVTGTDTSGKPYVSEDVLGISLAPSGALRIEWDDGKIVGVGELVGNVLAVASWTNGRTVILTMQINPDGSLSGHWLRRTDRGNKGTEVWRKI